MLLKPRLYHVCWHALLLTVAITAAAELFLWELATTHPESGVSPSTYLRTVIYVIPVAFLASVAVASIARLKRH